MEGRQDQTCPGGLASHCRRKAVLLALEGNGPRKLREGGLTRMATVPLKEQPQGS